MHTPRLLLFKANTFFQAIPLRGKYILNPKSTHSLNGFISLKHSFSYENHGHKMESENISRIFGRFRYDENATLKNEPWKISQQIRNEKKNFSSLMSDIGDKEFNRFYGKASKRQDRRQGELPETYDGYEYSTEFARMGETNDYLIIYRTSSNGKKEKIIDLLDIGEVRRKYQKTASITKMSMSDCHRYIAVGVDLSNDEHQTYFIRDSVTGVFLNDRLTDCYNVKFSACAKFLYYVKQDDRLWSHAVYKHRIGSDSQEEDTLVFNEKDESFFIDITQTKDKKYMIINTSSKATTELHALNRETGEMKQLIGRQENCKAFCNHMGNKFFVLTNKDLITKEKCYDFKVVTMTIKEKSAKIVYVDQKQPKKQIFQDFEVEDFYVPEDGEIVKEIDLFSDNLVLYIQKEGTVYMKVIALFADKEAPYKIQLGSDYTAGTSIAPGLNENMTTSTFRFHVDTPFVYNQVFDYNFESKKTTLLQDFFLDGPKFNKDKYCAQIVYAYARDGQTIPITLLRPKNLPKDRQNKLLLHGYGSYGVSLEVGFSVNYLSALEEGWTLGFAHVRGGGERGQKWHDAAILDKKPTSFYDFIACAEFLIANGYTHPSLLCAYGASAGGVLVGAVMNMRPELFKACVLNYPFLDVLSSLLDEKQALSASDYDEFGNPVKNEYYYDLISSYSPYENIQTNKEYPAVFITCGQNDHRAPVWNVLKYVNRFRERVSQPTRIKQFAPKNIVLNILDSGHQGEQGALAGIKERAQYLSFLEHVVTKCNHDVTIQTI